MKPVFKFQILDVVRIKELECVGTVRQCSICFSGIQYEVRYFYNGDAKSVWFYESELEAKS